MYTWKLWCTDFLNLMRFCLIFKSLVYSMVLLLILICSAYWFVNIWFITWCVLIHTLRIYMSFFLAIACNIHMLIFHPWVISIMLNFVAYIYVIEVEIICFCTSVIKAKLKIFWHRFNYFFKFTLHDYLVNHFEPWLALLLW